MDEEAFPEEEAENFPEEEPFVEDEAFQEEETFDEDAEAAEGPNSKRLVEVRDVLIHLDHPELEVRVLLARENIPGDQAIRSRANLGDLY